MTCEKTTLAQRDQADRDRLALDDGVLVANYLAEVELEDILVHGRLVAIERANLLRAEISTRGIDRVRAPPA